MRRPPSRSAVSAKRRLQSAGMRKQRSSPDCVSEEHAVSTPPATDEDKSALTQERHGPNRCLPLPSLSPRELPQRFVLFASIYLYIMPLGTTRERPEWRSLLSKFLRPSPVGKRPEPGTSRVHVRDRASPVNAFK